MKSYGGIGTYVRLGPLAVGYNRKRTRSRAGRFHEDRFKFVIPAAD